MKTQEEMSVLVLPEKQQSEECKHTNTISEKNGKVILQRQKNVCVYLLIRKLTFM